jgi:hypothetical protein
MKLNAKNSIILASGCIGIPSHAPHSPIISMLDYTEFIKCTRSTQLSVQLSLTVCKHPITANIGSIALMLD